MQKCKDLLTAKEARSELDEKNTNYTDQLTKQSKKLASKLKSQHVSDKQMRKEFDNLWVNWTTDVMKYQPPSKQVNVKPIVQKVLLTQFKNHPNILDKVDYGLDLFKFDKEKHIQQSFWKGHFGIDFQSNQHIQVILKMAIHTVDKYITDKENERKDFDENFIYEILSNMKKTILEFESRPDNPKFTKEFIVDLSVHFCLKNVSRLQKMHKEFRNANHPLTYLESQRETYFQTFKNYCKGASSVTIFVDFLCKNITTQLINATHNKSSEEIADRLKSNNPALSGNRSNLEAHILKDLATREDFDRYEEYIDHPKIYFERFIKEHVLELCHDIYLYIGKDL